MLQNIIFLIFNIIHIFLFSLNKKFFFLQTESPSHRPSNNKTPTKSEAGINVAAKSTKSTFIALPPPVSTNSSSCTLVTASNILSNNSSTSSTPRKGKRSITYLFYFIFLIYRIYLYWTPLSAFLLFYH